MYKCTPNNAVPCTRHSGISLHLTFVTSIRIYFRPRKLEVTMTPTKVFLVLFAVICTAISVQAADVMSAKIEVGIYIY